MISQKFKIVKKSSSVPSGKIIDIGCGTGYFAGFMKNKGWNSAGIESDPDAKRFAENNFGLHVYNLKHLDKFDPGEFDSVTMWHVLEHLFHPGDILTKIHSLLKNKGTCIIALPNRDSLDARYYKEMWAAYDVPRHLWHFNIESFNTLIKKSSFQIKKIKRMPFDAFYISIISERYKGSRIAIVKGLLFGTYSWIVSLFDKSKSSSLIYVLTKSN